MRRAIAKKISNNFQVDLVQSVVHDHNQNDFSIIEQLNMDDDITVDNLNIKSNIYSRGVEQSNFGNSRVIEYSPRNRYSFDRGDITQAQKNIQKLINSKARAKVQKYQKKSSFLFPQLSSTTTNHKTHRKLNKMHSNFQLLQQSKPMSQQNIKMKVDFKRSGILKYKTYITDNLIPECQFCQTLMLELRETGLICMNRECREKRIFQEVKSFPLLGVLYDMEIPSCNLNDLKQLSAKIIEELDKIEKWRKSLIQLQFQIERLSQSKASVMQKDKSQIKKFISSLQSLKKTQIDSFLPNQQLHIQLISLNLSQHYNQFKIWQNICQNQHFKQLSQTIQSYKPLCLKSPKNHIPQLATLNNNYNNTPIKLNISMPTSFTFNKLEKLILVIDGSFQLNCLLLLEEVRYLELEFQNKKTSRELRQLFHRLPKCRELCVRFDYKMHSHVSSEGFPLVSKLFQVGCEELSVQIVNARPQTIQDLYSACNAKIMTPKTKLNLKITMNQFLVEDVHVNQESENIQWGTKILINLLRSCGQRLLELNIDLPIQVQRQQIIQFILNNDYPKLLILRIKTLQKEDLPKDQPLQSLLNTIINKKNHILGLLVNAKRNKSNKLNQRSVRQAAFDMLI